MVLTWLLFFIFPQIKSEKSRRREDDFSLRNNLQLKKKKEKKNETPSLIASAAFAKIPLRSKRYVIHHSVTIG